MYDRLISYMLKHNILFEYLCGFEKGKFTHMEITPRVDRIAQALGNGECVVGVVPDFSISICNIFGFTSNNSAIKCDDPQGSILGPLLFL